MKILVICSDYPNNIGGRAMAYVHTRNLLYLKRGSSIDVINFEASNDYIVDGIRVHNEEWLNEERIKEYDLVLFHAANLRQHYKLLRRYDKSIRKIVFFYHGHEVLKISKVYSKPFDYVKVNACKRFLQDIYDEFKFVVWRRYLPKIADKAYFIFVSQWMKNEFLKWIKPTESLLKDRSFITYNCVGKIFEEESFNKLEDKEFDFITIRGNLDNSKYGIDIVNELAMHNPDMKFLLIGKGDFFNHYRKSSNIVWLSTSLSHDEIPQYLDKAKVALMPTRTDAQGVMMCEMAAYGMPVITSDIPVCHEVFNGFTGIGYINNSDISNVKLKELKENIELKSVKNPKYFNSVIGNQEYDILEQINNA